MDDTSKNADVKPEESTAETTEKAPEAVAPESGEKQSADASEKESAPLRSTIKVKDDPLTQKALRLSIFFAILALICIGFLTWTYIQRKKAEHPPATETHVTENFVAITENLGDFAVTLSNQQELRMELVAECTEKETCTFLKDHPPQVLDLVQPILANIDSNDILSTEAKKLVRKKIADRLNALEGLPGKVIQVHITNLNIEGTAKAPHS